MEESKRVIKVNIDDKPDVARGKRGKPTLADIFAMHEDGLMRANSKAFKQLFEDAKLKGDSKFGSLLLFGTGGDIDKQYLSDNDYRNLFYNPSNTRLLLPNTWDESNR